MPRSKRAKVVALTKTDKKGAGRKTELIEEVRKCAEEYAHIYTFSVENMRNAKLKEVRSEWKDSRFFFAKNKVMAIALGRTPNDEHKPGTHKVSHYLRNNVGLLFTNREPAEVKQWFAEYKQPEYARSGNKAGKTVTINEGPLAFPHTMEPKLRKLGLPVKLVRGVVTLTKDYTICKEGDILDPSQAKLLEYFEITMVQFHIILMTHFHDGKLTELVSKEAIAEAIKPGPKRNAEQRDAGDDEEEDENAEDAAMEQDGDDDEANDFDE